VAVWHATIAQHQLGGHTVHPELVGLGESKNQSATAVLSWFTQPKREPCLPPNSSAAQESGPPRAKAWTESCSAVAGPQQQRVGFV